MRRTVDCEPSCTRLPAPRTLPVQPTETNSEKNNAAQGFKRNRGGNSFDPGAACHRTERVPGRRRHHQAGRPLPGRRRHRCHRAHRGGSPLGAVERERHRREHRGRGRKHRHGPGREGADRRLDPVHGAAADRDQPVPLRQARLRPGEGPRPDLAGREPAEHPGGEEAAHRDQDGQGPDRLRQGQSRQAQLCVVRATARPFISPANCSRP